RAAGGQGLRAPDGPGLWRADRGCRVHPRARRARVHLALWTARRAWAVGDGDAAALVSAWAADGDRRGHADRAALRLSTTTLGAAALGWVSRPRQSGPRLGVDRAWGP